MADIGGPLAARPAMFRALGRDDPPVELWMAGRRWTREAVIKHDSWAATARYVDDGGVRAACKFNRVQPLLGLPTAWLGRRLAAREAAAMELLRGVPGFPVGLGPVRAGGRVLPNAVAHLWIDGTTFRPWAVVGDGFFPQLRAMVAEMHRRDMAYVDLSKWENLLVGADGRPYLIDFQIHLRLPAGHAGHLLVRELQAADEFHLYRHWSRCRPDQVPLEAVDAATRRTPLVELADLLGGPWRAFRRWVLRTAGVGSDDRRGGAVL